MKNHLKLPQWHYIILIQAIVAMLGSLYYGFYGDPVAQMATGDFFNSVNALTPCELCRYARILMYPIVAISGVGIIRQKRDYIYYILPLIKLGLILEGYHYFLQMVQTDTGYVCTANNPCEALEVAYFGFLTIPALCFIAFAVIGVACYMIWKKNVKWKEV